MHVACSPASTELAWQLCPLAMWILSLTSDCHQVFCRLQELASRLQAENEHLKHDNERLGRVIDSGEWGRARVAELEQAGEKCQNPARSQAQ